MTPGTTSNSVRTLLLNKTLLGIVSVASVAAAAVVLVAPAARAQGAVREFTVKADQYARAGIQFYWRVEQAANGAPLVYTYVLDPANGRYHDGDVFTGVVKLAAPFSVEIDLSQI